MQHSPEVERDRGPEGRGADLPQAADAELVQAAVAACGDREFGDRRTLLPNRFRVVGRQALAEGEPRLGVVNSASVRGAAALGDAIFVSHRNGDAAASLFHGGDVFDRREAAVQPLHLPSVRVRRRTARLFAGTFLALFLLLLKRFEILQRGGDELRTHASRPLHRRSTTSVGRAAGLVVPEIKA